MKDVGKRRDRIIEAVVSKYLETAEPVGSAYVCAHCELGVSPATIRTVMQELEEEGFLVQPHPSAGRVPTVKCYRYYVRNLMPSMEIDDTDLSAVRRLADTVIRESDADLFLNHVASALSEVTDLIGVVISPSFEQGVFDRLEIVNLGGSRYILIVSLRSGLVRTINITVDHIIPRRRVEETARLLTSRLSGKTVADIKRTIGNCLREVNGGDRQLLDIILTRSDSLFGFSEDRNVHVAGLTRLLTHPDFATVDYSLKVADLFEHKVEIAEVLRNTGPDGEVNIAIGGNGLWGSRPPLSLVSAVYSSGDSPGCIAVLGPTRVHYPRLSAIVKYAAAMTTRFLSS
jgi:heat-inducible transcriptional repressor